MAEQKTEKLVSMPEAAQLKASIAKLATMVSLLEQECDNLCAGRKAAGPRLRKGLLTISKTCGDIRKDVLTQTRAIPVKPRRSGAEPVLTQEEVKAEVKEVDNYVASDRSTIQPVEEAAFEPVKKSAKKPRGRRAK